jgi:hypothetical protein
MSNILATISRNVQYTDTDGYVKAAIVTDVNEDGSVELYVLDSATGPRFINGVKEFDAYARKSQANVYRNTWQGR